jgi:hypothetical protein
MPDCVAFSRSAARVNEPSSHTAMTALIWRRGIGGIGLSLENLMEDGNRYYFNVGGLRAYSPAPISSR